MDQGGQWNYLQRAGVTGIVIDPTNPAIVYLGTNRGAYRTTDSGATWKSIINDSFGSPYLTRISAIAIDPLHPATLYIAGFNVIYRVVKTVDGGQSWTYASSGLPAASPGSLATDAINGLAVDPAAPNIVYAATATNGIYRSTDSGANWSRSSTGLANSITNSVTVDPHLPGTVYVGTSIGSDAFAIRLNQSGSAADNLLSFGGSENDYAQGVALDADGSAYIGGLTRSQNFPVQNAFQSTSAGGYDAFVTKLNPSGTGFIYSTYLGGTGNDYGYAIAAHGNSAYITGQTGSPNFPLVNAFKTTLSKSDIDIFVTKLSPSGSSLDFSSYLGGSYQDTSSGIAVDSDGATYIIGRTASPDFPSVAATQPKFGGYYDAFVTKVSPSGQTIDYSTFIGGDDFDAADGIALDTAGNAYVIGTTYSGNFPAVNPFQSALGGAADAFVSKISVAAPGADLAITMKDSPDPVTVNNAVTYTLDVRNNGPSASMGVRVTDNLPSAVNFKSVTPSQGSCTLTNAITTIVT